MAVKHIQTFITNSTTTRLVVVDHVNSINGINNQILKFDSNFKWIFISGTPIIKYQYDSNNPDHVAELARLEAYAAGRNVIVVRVADEIIVKLLYLESRPSNEWINYNVSDDGWVSSVLDLNSIYNLNGDETLILCMVQIDDKPNEESSLAYCKLNTDTITINTNSTKKLLVYGSDCNVTAGSETYLFTGYHTSPLSFTGSATLVPTGKSYALAIHTLIS